MTDGPSSTQGGGAHRAEDQIVSAKRYIYILRLAEARAARLAEDLAESLLVSDQNRKSSLWLQTVMHQMIEEIENGIPETPYFTHTPPQDSVGA